MLPTDFESAVLSRLEALPTFRSAVTETRREDTMVRVTLPDRGLQEIGDAYDTQSRNKIDALLSLLRATQVDIA